MHAEGQTKSKCSLCWRRGRGSHPSPRSDVTGLTSARQITNGQGEVPGSGRRRHTLHTSSRLADLRSPTGSCAVVQRMIARVRELEDSKIIRGRLLPCLLGRPSLPLLSTVVYHRTLSPHRTRLIGVTSRLKSGESPVRQASRCTVQTDARAGVRSRFILVAP
jgi:hypothetical protein